MIILLWIISFCFYPNDYPPLPLADDTIERSVIINQMIHPMYGPWPEDHLQRLQEKLEIQLPELDATYSEWNLFSVKDPSRKLKLGVFLPNKLSTAPLFLTLNKCGNHTLHPHPDIPEGSLSFRHKTGCKNSSRGSHAPGYGVNLLIKNGIALATFAESDMDADSTLLRDIGIRSLYQQDWGALSAWAWGLSEAANELKKMGFSKVFATGHSRRGKAALLATAMNQNIDGVFVNQSGLGGTASLRQTTFRESAKLMTHGSFLYPLIGDEKSLEHFFTKKFKDLSRNPESLPFDAHHLMALVAPRVLVDFQGSRDFWSGPQSAKEMIKLASKAWGLSPQF